MHLKMSREVDGPPPQLAGVDRHPDGRIEAVIGNFLYDGTPVPHRWEIDLEGRHRMLYDRRSVPEKKRDWSGRKLEKVRFGVWAGPWLDAPTEEDLSGYLGRD